MRLHAEINGKNLINPGRDGQLRHGLAHFVVSSNRMILDGCFFFQLLHCQKRICSALADMDMSVSEDEDFSLQRVAMPAVHSEVILIGFR